ncbi:hypothetical protein PGT21_023312 [Puccinia graminis f. sp. tritici]|uniref:Uncharacterized protein n=1 Tax=Puccinia graminis f. sp. tritici TaxID=56615 RepID=A0A5B0NB38_PUCGR|nr:hypothetical protein PGT21_023312 [Puccinia graminis f. sp. tritici]KAA1113742.1 hypothetical protein PGTUg99_009584 [Puccinia graminis f. sp. tritici]
MKDHSQPKQRSPSGSRIKESINGLVHRVKEVISPPPSETSFPNSSHRGRSPDRKECRTASTGRGGAGNMVSSKSREGAKISNKQDEEVGERFIKKHADLPRSHGRGGAGNIRSRSRDLKTRVEEQSRIKELEEEEKAIEALYDDRHKLDTVHVGRGGAGNSHVFDRIKQPAMFQPAAPGLNHPADG